MKRKTMPKAIIIGAFLIYIPGQFAFAQSDEEVILELVSNAEYELAQKKVDEMVRQRPGTAKSLYFQALIEKDAEKAIKSYNDVLLLHRKSSYAPKALYRIAQYYFVKGFYYSSRKNFLDLIEKYPNSKNVSAAGYYAAKCLLATGKADSARIEFENVIKKKIPKAINDLVLEDLNALKHDEKKPVPILSAPRASPPETSVTEKKYTIQIGAYSRYENAESQKKYYALRGYDVEIARAKVNRRYFYKVYVGRYVNQAEAEMSALAFKRKHGLSYRIVKLEDESGISIR